MAQELIRMEHICKEFPGVRALDDVSFDLRSGEVHALIGENGAGKSTLMKVLTGNHTKNSGSIFVRGKELEMDNVRVAQGLGIIMIHQELNLMPHLTVAQNIFIGRESKKGGLFLSDTEINRKSKEIFMDLHIDIDPTTLVGRLSVAQQQMVEIAKALSYQSEVLIMDEPTASLTDSEIEELFRIIRLLRKQGKGIIYISHRLEELKQITDRITVMRDGQYIDTIQTEDSSIEQIIHMMVGREIFVEKCSRVVPDNAPVALEVRGLNCGRQVQDVSFHIRRGEILGFAGLMGAGRTETARALYGADRKQSGEILVNGEPVSIQSPYDAVQHGIAYLSEDRKRYGLMLGLDLETNISMSSMSRFVRGKFFISGRRTTENAQKMVTDLNVKTPSVRQLAKLLSGGNQQKVVLAKWLTRNCDVLIVDEPTRGIDVGAKSEIYKLLNELADSGKAVIVISSELPEIIRTSNRVMVMCEGRITGEVSGDEINQKTIMGYATMRSL